MQDALQIMIAGLGGVFAGMTLLYILIRITSAAAAHLARRHENDG